MRRYACTSLVLSLGLASCGLGKVPATVVELYDMAKVDGIMELELDRDGTILEIEVEVPKERLPARVQAAALNRVSRVANAQIVGAEREIHPEGRFWEAKLRAGGTMWEVIVDDNGNVIETEREIAASEAPPAVLAAADKAIPGGVRRSVEIIERGETVVYHVKKARNNANYKVVLTPDGTVLRRVREARAELEIPLAR